MKINPKHLLSIPILTAITSANIKPDLVRRGITNALEFISIL